MIIVKGGLARISRLLFAFSVIFYTINFADSSPDLSGLTRDDQTEKPTVSVEFNNVERPPNVITPDHDYNYFPLEALTEEDSAREFESFLKDPRNAGLNYNLVKRFNKTTRSNFLDNLVLGKPFTNALIESGVDLSKADQWISQSLEKGTTFSLWAIHHDFIDFKNDQASLLKFIEALQNELELNDESLSYKNHADFDDIGSLKNQSIGSELQNRVDHLIMFASQSNNDENISSYHYGLVFAISIWMTRNILISSSNNGEGQNLKDQFNEIERRKLSTMFQGVNLQRDFMVEGKVVKSSIASALIHANSVFETKGLAKVQDNIESIFWPYLENHRIQIQQSGGKGSLLLKKFDQSYSNLQKYQQSFQDLKSSIGDLLSSYGVKIELKSLQNRGQLARFLAVLARKGISSEDINYLVDSLENLSKTRLYMMSEVIQLNGLFNKIYSHLEEYKRDSNRHKFYLKDWITEYDENSEKLNRKTYVEEVQSLFLLWKDHFPNLIKRFKVAFQNSTSQCLHIFKDTKLKDIRVDIADHIDIFDSSLKEISPEYKRVACLLDYELRLRQKYAEKIYTNLFDDGFYSIHYNLEDLAQEYSMSSSMGSTSPTNRSVYGLVYDLMKDRTNIILVTSKDLLKSFKPDVEEVLRDTFLPLERQPINSRGEFPMKLPKGILHSLSGEVSDGGNIVDIVWEKPIPSPTFFGTTLGICIGDDWLKKRDNFQKGQGGLELINEISRYMPNNDVEALLARRALLYKYNTLRQKFLKKRLLGDKSSLAKLSAKDLSELQYVEKMSEKKFIQAKPIHPVMIEHEYGSTWVGFGYGFIGDPTGVRPLVGQAQLGSILHWEAVPPNGRDKEVFIHPIMDFNYRPDESENTRYGPIFNLYFPVYKLESTSVSNDQFKIASVGFTEEELKQLFKRKIQASQQQFNYLADGKSYFIRFSDSILRSGMLLMDAFANHEQHPPGISWKQKHISPQ